MRKILQLILRFLSRLILWKYRPFVVVVTGSVGKTSHKEAIFTVLNYRFLGLVRRNEKNLNTEIGVPITIIGGTEARRNIFKWLWNFARAAAQILLPMSYPKVLVLEMGADRPGDIRYLTSFIKPDIAVVTAIGKMPPHLEFFSSREEYIAEKANAVSRLKIGGAALLNFDDEAVRKIADGIGKDKRIIFYGFGDGAEIRSAEAVLRLPVRQAGLPESAEKIESAGLVFKMEYKSKTVPFRVFGTASTALIYAAMAAAGVGIEKGMNFIELSEAISTIKALPGRLRFLEGIKYSTIIDDTYNASPLSTELALNLLSRFKERRRLAVLGDMKELGPNTEAAHRHIGRLAALNCDLAVLVGEAMVFAEEELVRAGFEEDKNLFWFGNVEKTKRPLQEMIKEGDAILFKGSQSMRLEKAVEEVMARPELRGELLVRQDKYWRNKPV